MTGKDFINFAEEYLHLICLEFHLNEPSALAHNQSSPCNVRLGLLLLGPTAENPRLQCDIEEQKPDLLRLEHMNTKPSVLCHNYELNELTVIISRQQYSNQELLPV